MSKPALYKNMFDIHSTWHILLASKHHNIVELSARHRCFHIYLLGVMSTISTLIYKHLTYQLKHYSTKLEFPVHCFGIFNLTHNSVDKKSRQSCDFVGRYTMRRETNERHHFNNTEDFRKHSHGCTNMLVQLDVSPTAIKQCNNFTQYLP